MLFISDIHGSLSALENALQQGEKLGFSHLVLLGDLLNHGPRNAIQPGYDPQGVANTLNQFSNRIIAVRGNCDGEVDQMLCKFPLMADYNWLTLSGRRLFLCHGHQWSPDNLPPLAAGEGFACGHTHIPVAEWQNQRLHFNPGSVTLAKGGHKETFGHFDGERFAIYDLNGQLKADVAWTPA